ncbi:hypothetical protein RHECNPAF_2940056 [Rhizobium etli CNPAF512]|nr:hypothetical protein RHECNPAF_2940056 [Rhizobium etli CNPAF512]
MSFCCRARGCFELRYGNKAAPVGRTFCPPALCQLGLKRKSVAFQLFERFLPAFPMRSAQVRDGKSKQLAGMKRAPAGTGFSRKTSIDYKNYRERIDYSYR